MSRASALIGRSWRFALRRSGEWARNVGLGPGLSRPAAARLIRASGLFDAAWYAARYADIRRDPLSDYLDRGLALGRNPSPLFWTAWYADRHPASKAFGGGSLVHYLLGHGTEPNPLFDDAWYAAHAAPFEGAALADYVNNSGNDPHPLFRTAHYVNQGPTDDAWRSNPLAHFLEWGSKTRRSPSPHFDAAMYLSRYVDVGQAGVNPLIHYLTGGARDLRDPSPTFSTLRYLRRSTEARRSPHNPLAHAVMHDAIALGEAAAPGPLPAAAPPTQLTLTAIVPNYNHTRFLPERFETILAQTRQPDQLIVLDDASPDDSLAVIERYAARFACPVTVLANEENSGSPFGQWAKALRLATGDLVWVAESDDRCRPELVAALLAAFDDDRVTMAYCQSEPIDADGTPLAQDYRFYTDDLSIDRWEGPYVAAGRDEVTAALTHKNTIPNASAVIFRRSAVLPLLDDLPSYRQCGDWRLYLECAAAGRIAFVPHVLNDHRRHAGALTIALGGDLAPLVEAIRVRLDTIARFDLAPASVRVTIAAMAAEYVGRTAPDAPLLADRPEFASQIAAIRQVISHRLRPGRGTSLAILDIAEDATEVPAAVLDLLNRFGAAMAILTRPRADEPAWTTQIAPAQWLEGSAVLSSWSAPALWIGSDVAGHEDRLRILANLARLYGLDSIVAHGAEATRLAGTLAERAGMRLAGA